MAVILCPLIRQVWLRGSAIRLLHVDFLASGVSLFWPRSGIFHCEAADRKQRSRERLNCLACRVFICISCQKWGVAWLAFGVSGFICESLTSMAECPDSTPTKSIERVCVSPSSKEQICLLCAKVVSNSDFRRKLTTSGGQKTKTCLTLESTLGKEISSDCFLTNILCRTCGIYLVFYLFATQLQ